MSTFKRVITGMLSNREEENEEDSESPDTGQDSSGLASKSAGNSPNPAKRRPSRPKPRNPSSSTAEEDGYASSESSSTSVSEYVVRKMVLNRGGKKLTKSTPDLVDSGKVLESSMGSSFAEATFGPSPIKINAKDLKKIPITRSMTTCTSTPCTTVKAKMTDSCQSLPSINNNMNHYLSCAGTRRRQFRRKSISMDDHKLQRYSPV